MRILKVFFKNGQTSLFEVTAATAQNPIWDRIGLYPKSVVKIAHSSGRAIIPLHEVLYFDITPHKELVKRQDLNPLNNELQYDNPLN